MAQVATKQNKTAEAHARYLRVSPRKMRLVTNLVKGMYADEALTQLQFTNKKAARYVYKLIQSAVANASNNFKMNKDALVIKSITCDAGPKLKRFMPRAQGRATPVRKPLSHIHVILEEKQNAKRRKKFTAPQAAKQESAKAVEPESADKEEGKQQNIRSQVDKTEQQTKANKVQQKRRLFNRKSGV